MADQDDDRIDGRWLAPVGPARRRAVGGPGLAVEGAGPRMTTAPLSHITRGSLRRASPQLSVTKARQSRDAPVLADLLDLHAVARPQVLDCTYGTGVIWGRLPIRREVIKVDINPALPGLDFVCDWLELPRYVMPGSLDVLVWDPIQVSDVGKSSQLYQRYVADQTKVRGTDAVVDLFPGFLEMARQVLEPRTGIVLAKMCDQVHSQRFRWQVFALVGEAQRRGWTACQPRALFNPAPPPIPGVHRQYHSRNDVAYWLVLRNGPSCCGPGRAVRHERRCQSCAAHFCSRRSDAATCSDRCRQRLSRWSFHAAP